MARVVVVAAVSGVLLGRLHTPPLMERATLAIREGQGEQEAVLVEVPEVCRVHFQAPHLEMAEQAVQEARREPAEVVAVAEPFRTSLRTTWEREEQAVQ